MAAGWGSGLGRAGRIGYDESVLDQSKKNSSVERRPRDWLPLKPAVFHILLALAERDSHGYGVIRAVRDSSQGCLRLQTGHFYRHLKRLIDDGLVAEADDRPPDDDPRRGAYYTLTALGRQVLAAEGRRLAELAVVTEKLGLLRPGESS